MGLQHTCNSVDLPAIHPGPCQVPRSDRQTFPSCVTPHEHAISRPEEESYRIKIRIESVFSAIGLYAKRERKDNVTRPAMAHGHVLDGRWALIVIGAKENVEKEAM